MKNPSDKPCDHGQKKKWIKRLHQELLKRKAHAWENTARQNQKIPDGPWRIWLILAGRGFGKTRTGAETVRSWVTSGTYRRICLLGRTLEEVRQIMIEGESGLLNISPAWEKLEYAPSRRTLYWPNGAQATAYSAENSEQLRGPQFDAAWIDELAKFPHIESLWDQLMMGLRLGTFPRIIITTTPKPIAFLQEIMKRPDVHITRGSTFDNKEHLAEGFLNNIEQSYRHTRLGAQEIYGEILENQNQGFWRPQIIPYHQGPLPNFERVVIAIDPAVTTSDTSNETGIIVAAKDDQGRGYILDDLSGCMTPTEWITKSVKAFKYHQADRLIAEVNNGGDLVQHLIEALFPQVPYKGVYASRGKRVRAEPVLALYEQGRIFHRRYFDALEAQMINPNTVSSPDRLDALVWALTELFLGKENQAQKISIDWC